MPGKRTNPEYCTKGHHLQGPNIYANRGRIYCVTCRKARWKKGATPGPTLQERFWDYVDKAPGQGSAGECWIWKGILTASGYGTWNPSKGARFAHRYAFEQVAGEIPHGLFVLHSCDTRACVNPSHLRVGTHQDNMNDMLARNRHALRNKTHCQLGHPLSGENLRMEAGKRACKVCRKRKQSENYLRRKEQKLSVG